LDGTPPRVLLDANVLVPSVLREILLGAAGEGAFVPLWSARILEEWARAARRLPEGAEAVARAEIAALRVAWPAAEVPPDPDREAVLALPDPHDVHVLAAAIAGGASVVLTRDRAGFPSRTLARHGLIAREPDGFLCEIHGELGSVGGLGSVVAVVRARAEAASGRPQAVRPMLKRGGLPRLGKALAGEA
jgi:predicted nucleic acid-binding protein